MNRSEPSRESIQVPEEDSTLTFQRIWEEVTPQEKPVVGEEVLENPLKSMTPSAQELLAPLTQENDPLAEKLENALLNFFSPEDQGPSIPSKPLENLSVSVGVDKAQLMEDLEQLYPGGLEEIFSHAVVSTHDTDTPMETSFSETNPMVLSNPKDQESPEPSKIIETSAELIHTIKAKLKAEFTPVETPVGGDLAKVNLSETLTTTAPQMGFLPIMQWVQESKPPIAINDLSIELKMVDGKIQPTVLNEAFEDISFPNLLEGDALANGEAFANPDSNGDEFFNMETAFDMPKAPQDKQTNAPNGDMKISPQSLPATAQTLQGPINLTDTIATQRMMAPPTPQSQQLFVEVRKALDEGNDKITVKLTPASLGKVDIKIEVTPDGRSTVVIATERPETLDLFRKDASFLQASLSEMGLELDLGESSFNLMDSFDGKSDQRANSSKSKDEALPENPQQLYQYMSSHRGLYQEFA